MLETHSGVEIHSLRPFTYSFSNIMTISDVRRLMLATIFRQMSHTMTYILDINGMNP
jgi:hypothetical protein